LLARLQPLISFFFSSSLLCVLKRSPCSVTLAPFLTNWGMRFSLPSSIPIHHSSPPSMNSLSSFISLGMYFGSKIPPRRLVPGIPSLFRDPMMLRRVWYYAELPPFRQIQIVPYNSAFPGLAPSPPLFSYQLLPLPPNR